MISGRLDEEAEPILQLQVAGGPEAASSGRIIPTQLASLSGLGRLQRRTARTSTPRPSLDVQREALDARSRDMFRCDDHPRTLVPVPVQPRPGTPRSRAALAEAESTSAGLDVLEIPTSAVLGDEHLMTAVDRGDQRGIACYRTPGQATTRQSHTIRLRPAGAITKRRLIGEDNWVSADDRNAISAVLLREKLRLRARAEFDPEAETALSCR